MNTFYPSEVWRYCPYCGSQQMEWQDGTHCMHCKVCRKVFYINQSAAVVAIIENNKNEILFTRRKNDPAKGTLDLPGGFIDLFETAEVAVCREVKEELNLIVDKLNFLETFPNRYLYGGIVYFTLDIAFRCTVNDFSTLKAADDVSAYEFISPQNIVLEDIGLDSILVIASKL